MSIRRYKFSTNGGPWFLSFHLPIEYKKLFLSMKSAILINSSIGTLGVYLSLILFLGASKPAPWGMLELSPTTSVTRMAPGILPIYIYIFLRKWPVFNIGPAFLHNSLKNMIEILGDLLCEFSTVGNNWSMWNSA